MMRAAFAVGGIDRPFARLTNSKRLSASAGENVERH
jgi:hypothetical protein